MSDTTSAPVLLFENVKKVYRAPRFGRTLEITGIESLTLEVHPGEIFGLLGLNGSGKTTTIKLGLGLIGPTAGRVELFGKNPQITLAPGKAGYLPELPCFYPHLNSEESLRFYGRLSRIEEGELESRTEAVLSKVGLSPHRQKKVAEFSRGMLQRLGFAQALLHDPDLLVLDEPVSGLDPLAVKQIRELIVQLSKGGKSVFLSSHNISEVESVCNRVGILVEGRLAKVLEREQWGCGAHRLEELFVETVS